MNKVIIKSGEKYYVGCIINKDSTNSELHVMKLTLGGYKNETYGLTTTKVNKINIYHIDEFEGIEQDIKEKYDKQVSYLKKTIASVKGEDYQDSVTEEYERLKGLIVRTASNMIEDIEYNDEGFENRLKEICQLKKQLFSIPNEGVKEARKHNGNVKYKIKQLEKEYTQQMKLLNIDKFKELMGVD